MTETRLPVLQSVAAAYAFAISHGRQMLIAALPYTLASVLMVALPVLGEGFLFLGPFLWLAGTIASLALSAAAFRMAVLGDHSGWYGLQIGADEGRLLIVNLLISALTLVVGAMAVMSWLVVFSSVAAASLGRAGVDPENFEAELMEVTSYLGTADWVVIIGAGLAAGAIMVWLTSRLAMSFPATIERKKIQVLSVWGLSKGNAWRIALAILLTSTPLILVEVAMYEAITVIFDSRFLYSEFVLGPDGIVSPVQSRLMEYMNWVSMMALINVPVVSGLYAYIYRGLTSK